jgi:hypothetical protein
MLDHNEAKQYICLVMTFFILHIKILHLAPCHNILDLRMFTKLH